MIHCYVCFFQRPVMQDVHMHRPHTTSKHFIDALGAFWPGLQVLMGDLKPAIESHEILYQIMQRHNFIPEVNSRATYICSLAELT